MSRNSQYTAEQKIKAVQDYLNGIRSVVQICSDLEVKSKRKMGNRCNRVQSDDE